MTNVLPQKARKTVWRMYRARFVLAGSLVALSSALLSAAALSPSYLILQTDSSGTVTQNKTDAATAVKDRAAILETQSLLAVLTPLLNATTSKEEMISTALSVRPADISINHITLTSGKPGTMIVGGSAKNISAINAYRKALEGNGSFSSVAVPVGDLAGTQNGQFSITLTGNF